MADIWLPGFERWELPGVPGLPYDEFDDPKAVLHTTEGGSIDGAVKAYSAYPPQLIVDPVKKRKVQHIPLNRAGYALWNGDADDSHCYQVEIVGYASQTHLWSDEVLKWLGEELARPLHEYGGVPYVVVWKGFRRDGEMPFALASDESPLRLTQAELDSFSGFLGHQHVPGDDHWDPGGLNVARILDFAQSKEDADMSKEHLGTWPAGTNQKHKLTLGTVRDKDGQSGGAFGVAIGWEPCTIKAIYFIREDGHVLQIIPEFTLYADKRRWWFLPHGTDQISVHFDAGNEIAWNVQTFN